MQRCKRKEQRKSCTCPKLIEKNKVLSLAVYMCHSFAGVILTISIVELISARGYGVCVIFLGFHIIIANQFGIFNQV